MSVRIMAMVFERYHNGGGEMLLALSLADHAADDGTDVYPSIKTLATKTRQSERTVQYQLRRMEESGWLILVNSGNGGRNRRRQYMISPDWIKGANIAPLGKGATDGLKGADSGAKGCNPQQQRVQPVAPAYNHHITINEPSKKHKGVATPVSPDGKSESLDFSSWPARPSDQVWLDYQKLREKKKAPISQTVINRMADELRKAKAVGMSVDDFLSECLVRGWIGGKVDWMQPKESPKSQGFDPLAYVNRNRTKKEMGDVIDV